MAIKPEEVPMAESGLDKDMEKTIDDELRKPWYKGEKRLVDVTNLHPIDLVDLADVHPNVWLVVNLYKKLGWQCRPYGKVSVLFECPYKDKDRPVLQKIHDYFFGI